MPPMMQTQYRPSMMESLNRTSRGVRFNMGPIVVEDEPDRVEVLLTQLGQRSLCDLPLGRKKFNRINRTPSGNYEPRRTGNPIHHCSSA